MFMQSTEVCISTVCCQGPRMVQIERRHLAVGEVVTPSAKKQR